MFVRMRLRKWDDAFECKDLPFPVNIVGAGVGFLEVYETLSDLHKEYPGETSYLEIQESKPT